MIEKERNISGYGLNASKWVEIEWWSREWNVYF